MPKKRYRFHHMDLTNVLPTSNSPTMLILALATMRPPRTRADSYENDVAVRLYVGISNHMRAPEKGVRDEHPIARNVRDQVLHALNALSFSTNLLLFRIPPIRLSISWRDPTPLPVRPFGIDRSLAWGSLPPKTPPWRRNGSICDTRRPRSRNRPMS